MWSVPLPSWSTDFCRGAPRPELARVLTRPVPALGSIRSPWSAASAWPVRRRPRDPTPGTSSAPHADDHRHARLVAGTRAIRDRAAPTGYAVQILYLFAFGLPMTAVAAMITAPRRSSIRSTQAPLASVASALADQRWRRHHVGTGRLVPLIAFTVVVLPMGRCRARRRRHRAVASRLHLVTPQSADSIGLVRAPYRNTSL